MSDVNIKLSDDNINVILDESVNNISTEEITYNVELKEEKFNVQLVKETFKITTGFTGPQGPAGPEGPVGGTGHFEQGTGYSDITYLYVVYGVDEAWESVRRTRDLLERKTTGVQTGTKPTTLTEVQGLTYN